MQKMKSPEKKMHLSLHFINVLFYSGIACIAPFFSVHLRSIGLTTWHMVCIHTASGLVCMVIPLAIGSFAEMRSPRRHHYKFCFSTSLLVAALAYTALLSVPKVVMLPRQPLVDFDCSSPLSAVVNIERCANWATCSNVAAAWTPETSFRLSHCRFKDGPADFSTSQQSRNISSLHPIHVCFRSAEDTTNLCLVHDLHVRENSVLEFISDLRPWHFTEFRNVSVAEFLAPDPRTPPLFVDVCSFRPSTGASVIKVNNRKHDSVFCRPTAVEESKGVKCLLSIQSQGRTTPCYEVVGDPSFTFWLYLGLRAVGDSFFLAAVCLLEGIALRVIQSGPFHKGAYGKTRVLPMLAFMLISTPIGFLVDYYTSLSGYADYSPAFFLFAGFELVTCTLIFALPVPVGGNTVRYTIANGQPQRNTRPDPEQGPWLTLNLVVTSLIVICLGCSWGTSQIYDPLLYQDKDLNHTYLGLAHSLIFAGGIPFLMVSKILLQNIGESNLVSAGFAFHAIHLAGLSFIKEWSHFLWFLPFQLMEAFSLPIAWVALVAMVENGNSKGKRIALHYLIAQLHFGVGRMIGCIYSGLMSEYYSTTFAYRTLSAFCLFMSVFYLILHHGYLKPRQKKILEIRRSAQRLSVNGSCLQLMDRRPLNGGRQIH